MTWEGSAGRSQDSQACRLAGTLGAGASATLIKNLQQIYVICSNPELPQGQPQSIKATMLLPFCTCPWHSIWAMPVWFHQGSAEKQMVANLDPARGLVPVPWKLPNCLKEMKSAWQSTLDLGVQGMMSTCSSMLLHGLCDPSQHLKISTSQSLSACVRLGIWLSARLKWGNHRSESPLSPKLC